MDRLKTAEKKADEVKARYLVGLKNNLDRYLPRNGVRPRKTWLICLRCMRRRSVVSCVRCVED